MGNSGLPKLIYVLLAAAGLLYFSFLYPQLPDPMASHFNASGAVTAWTPKSGFFILITIVTLAASVPVFLVPRAMAKLPNDKINLPNKEYWLAPERRAETMGYLGVQMGWFGSALLALLLCDLYNAVAANFRPDHHFDFVSFYVVLGAFLAFIIVWLIRLLSHFARVRGDSPRSLPWIERLLESAVVAILAVVGVQTMRTYLGKRKIRSDFDYAMQVVAKEAVRRARAEHGVHLDFEPDSIEHLEDMLGRIHEDHLKNPLTEKELSLQSIRWAPTSAK